MNMWEVGCQNLTDRTDQEQTEFSGMWVPTATVRSDVTDDLIEVVTVVSDSHRRLGHLLRSPPACTKIPEIVSRKFMATVSRSPAVPLEVIQPFAVTKRLVNGLWFRLHYVHSVKNSCCQKSVLTSRTQIELRNCIASLQLIIVQTSAFTQHLHPNRSGCCYLPLCRCLSHRSQRGGKHVGFLGKVWLIVSKMWFTMLQPISVLHIEDLPLSHLHRCMKLDTLRMTYGSPQDSTRSWLEQESTSTLSSGVIWTTSRPFSSSEDWSWDSWIRILTWWLCRNPI